MLGAISLGPFTCASGHLSVLASLCIEGMIGFLQVG